MNEAFLRRLAERGGGSASWSSRRIGSTRSWRAIHRRIGTPLLTGLGLEPERLAIEPGEVVPRRLPDLFAGLSAPDPGPIPGTSGGIDRHPRLGCDGSGHREPVAARVRENPAIAAAWARGQIRQLEDRYAAGDGDRSNLEKAIVGLSLKFQVLCRVHGLRRDRPVAGRECGRLGASGHAAGRDAAGMGGCGLASLQHTLARVRRSSRPPSDQICARRCSVADHGLSANPPRHACVLIGCLDGLLTPRVGSAYELACASAARCPPPSERTLADRLRTDGRIAPREAAELIAELGGRLQVTP